MKTEFHNSYTVHNQSAEPLTAGWFKPWQDFEAASIVNLTDAQFEQMYLKTENTETTENTRKMDQDFLSELMNSTSAIITTAEWDAIDKKILQLFIKDINSSRINTLLVFQPNFLNIDNNIKSLMTHKTKEMHSYIRFCYVPTADTDDKHQLNPIKSAHRKLLTDYCDKNNIDLEETLSTAKEHGNLFYVDANDVNKSSAAYSRQHRPQQKKQHAIIAQGLFGGFKQIGETLGSIKKSLSNKN